jgi:hypothetical protein
MTRPALWCWGVVHRARNNLSADVQAGLQHLLGSAVRPGQQAVSANASDEPLYEARFCAQRVSVPVRPRLMDAQGRLVHARPTVWGTQTAMVVGLDAPVHTDRDARIKLQLHWQRGAQASHRLSAPMDDNAPASDASGTWVRVAQSSWAGGQLGRGSSSRAWDKRCWWSSWTATSTAPSSSVPPTTARASPTRKATASTPGRWRHRQRTGVVPWQCAPGCP